MKPLLVIGLVHVLGPFQPEHRQIGEEDPVQKAGVVHADPGHQTEGEPEALSERIRSRRQSADEEDAGKDQDAEQFRQKDVFRAVAHVQPLMRLEVFLQNVRGIVVDARRAVLPLAAEIHEKDRREEARENERLDQNDPQVHVPSSC